MGLKIYQALTARLTRMKLITHGKNQMPASNSAKSRTLSLVGLHPDSGSIVNILIIININSCKDVLVLKHHFMLGNVLQFS